MILKIFLRLSLGLDFFLVILVARVELRLLSQSYSSGSLQHQRKRRLRMDHMYPSAEGDGNECKKQRRSPCCRNL